MIKGDVLTFTVIDTDGETLKTTDDEPVDVTFIGGLTNAIQPAIWWMPLQEEQRPETHIVHAPSSISSVIKQDMWLKANNNKYKVLGVNEIRQYSRHSVVQYKVRLEQWS